jgi:hypothetical protein
MAALPALGTRADERLQDKAVHVASELLPAPDQEDGEVTAVLWGGFRRPPGICHPGGTTMTAPAGLDLTIGSDSVAGEALDRSAWNVHGLTS